MQRHLLLLLSIFIVLSAGFRENTASAQSSSAPYTGVNILYIIDQSGSMSGAFSTEASDPQNLRFVASQYAVDWLSDFRRSLVVETGTARPDINMSVVYFGTDAIPILDWTAIDTDSPTWQSNLQEQLRTDLSAERFAGRHLTDTDFNEAFAQSESELLRAGEVPSAGSNPLNVVVIVTDGGPCTRRDPGFQFQDGDTLRYTCTTGNAQSVDVLGTQQSRLIRLQDFVQSNLPNDDFRYYLIALDTNDEYWSDLESNWDTIVCDLTDPVPDSATCDNLHGVRVDTPIEMGTQMNLVLNDIGQQLIDTLPINSCILTPPQNQCVVPPYTQLMRVTAYKNDSVPLGNQIEILTPNSSPLTPLAPQRANTPIESYVIANPAPETWQINFSNNNSVERVVVDFIPAGVRLQPIGDLQVFEAQDLVLEIVDGAGNILPVDPTYQVTMTAQAYDATLPDKDLRPPVGDAIPLVELGNSFAGEWIPRDAGLFELRVSASYQRPDGSAVLFIDEYTVLDNVEVLGTTVNWSSRGISPSNTRQDRPITVSGIAQTVQTGDPILNTSAMQVRITTTNLDDPTLTDTIVLANQQVENATPGLVEVSHVISTPGNYQVNAEVGIPDPVTGVFVPLNPAAPTQFVTVNALVPLTIQILQPNQDNLFAQEFSLSPLQFNWSTDTPIQVQVTDANNNTVSLSAATGGTVTRPTVILNPERDNLDVTAQLQELRSGVYSLNLENLTMGRYTVVASIDPTATLVDNYTLQNSTVDKTFNRLLNPAIPIAIGVLIAILVIVGGILIWFYNRRQRRRSNPLRGALQLMMRYENGHVEPVQELNLETEVANEQEFKGLRGPYKRILLSTRNNPKVYEAGDLFIEELEFKEIDPLRNPKRIKGNGQPFDVGILDDETGSIVFFVTLTAKALGQAGQSSGLGALKGDGNTD